MTTNLNRNHMAYPTLFHAVSMQYLISVNGNMIDCNIFVSEFKLQFCYYIDFWIDTLGKDKNPINPPPTISELNISTAVFL